MKKTIPPYKAAIDADYARSCLTYNPETGEIHWKTRPASDFKTQRAFASWNTKFAGKPAFSTVKKQDGYASLVGRLCESSIRASHMAWLLHYGKWPRFELDHRNGNALDNRITNLREVSRLENNQNLARRLDNTSGQTGVAYMRKQKKWWAYINSYGQRVNLGYFAAFEDAVRVRLEAERRYDFHPNHGREPFANIAAAIAAVVRSRITSRMGETQNAA